MLIGFWIGSMVGSVFAMLLDITIGEELERRRQKPQVRYFFRLTLQGNTVGVRELASTREEALN